MITVKIFNWEKFNPRSDRANYTWLRFQNNFFLDQKVFGLSNSQVVLYVFLICEASKKNSAEISLRIDYILAILKTTKDKILNDLASLSELVSWSRHNDGEKPSLSRHGDVIEPSLLPATDVRTDDTNGGSASLALQTLTKIWNENRGPLPEARNPKRLESKARKRLEENGEESYWAEVVRRIVASPFCCGDNNRGWRATFSWLMNPSTHEKVMEGTYDSFKKETKPMFQVCGPND